MTCKECNDLFDKIREANAEAMRQKDAKIEYLESRVTRLLSLVAAVCHLTVEDMTPVYMYGVHNDD